MLPRARLVAPFCLALLVAACSTGATPPPATTPSTPATNAPATAAASESTAPSASVEPVALTVGLGFIPSVQFAQFYLAEQSGAYDAAGLDVTLQNKIDPELITLLGQGAVDIGSGDGTSVIPAVSQGIPVVYTDEPVPAGRRLVGIEAVIDKDLASALLAKDLRAAALLIVTDVDAVYDAWGTSEQRAIRRATPEALSETEFAAGSMGPKVKAACSFVEETGGLAVIGSIADTPSLLRGEAGTLVTTLTREISGLDAAGLREAHAIVASGRSIGKVVVSR